MTAETHPWVPAACTLPTPEHPLRVAEFDALFATALRRVERPSPTRLRLILADAEGRRGVVEELTARETACCSFFIFTITTDDDRLLVDVEVPAVQSAVLDALAEHSAARTA